MHVAICVATYRRQQGLSLLLESLPAAAAGVSGVAVIVADNEPSSETETIVAAFSAASSFPVTYIPVSQPGISAARNACISAAQSAEFVVLIDDDEVAPSGWLSALLAAREEYGADVVVGSVRKTFAEQPPAWMRSGRVFEFEDPTVPRGTLLRWCASNNTLITRRTLDLVPAGFSDDYGLTGGGDTHFFRRATLAGAEIRWVPEVFVTEHLSENRSGFWWQLKRRYRTGLVASRVDRELESWAALAIRLARGAGNVVRGLFAVLIGLAARDLPRAMWGCQRIAHGCGMVAGMMGLSYTDYKRRPG